MQHFFKNTTVPSTTKFANKGGDKIWGGRGGVVKQDEEETIINTLVFGEYDSLSDMATDINSGQKSDIVKKILYKQMCILLREDLKSL